MGSEQRSQAIVHQISAEELGYDKRSLLFSRRDLRNELNLSRKDFFDRCLKILIDRSDSLVKGDLIAFPFFEAGCQGAELIYDGKNLFELEEKEYPEVGFATKLPDRFSHIFFYPLDYWKKELINYIVNLNLAPFYKEIKETFQIQRRFVEIEETDFVPGLVNNEERMVMKRSKNKYEYETRSGTFSYEGKRYEVSISYDIGSLSYEEDKREDFLSLLISGEKDLHFPYNGEITVTLFIRQI